MMLTCFVLMASGFLGHPVDLHATYDDDDGNTVPTDTSAYAYCDADNVVLPSMMAPADLRLAYTLDENGDLVSQPDPDAQAWLAETKAVTDAIDALMDAGNGNNGNGN